MFFVFYKDVKKVLSPFKPPTNIVVIAFYVFCAISAQCKEPSHGLVWKAWRPLDTHSCEVSVQQEENSRLDRLRLLSGQCSTQQEQKTESRESNNSKRK